MILVNGVPEARIDARERGLHYGDGVFTTARVRDGRAALLERHLARLRTDSVQIGLPVPDDAALRADIARACAGVARGVLKIVLTRGASERGYRAPQPVRPTRIVQLSPWPEHGAGDDGVALRICALRLSAQPRLAGVKHLNRLEQVLARMEWDDTDITDGVMLDEHEHVIETVAANIFAVIGGRLTTPRLDRCGVRGVLRDVVLELARAAGMATDERVVARDELAGAQEVFITNSVIGMRCVRRIEQHAFARGPVYERLRGALERFAPDYA